ncbi:hypothetical protein [Kineococcus rhizosphaerae]|uniref:hypothetical protein n=1 Tax=Kineococcus rhizosphaerae TaxID=559628 RepID=UPI000D04AE95|nr:hypothetical protein [Kineococcus rhizosphaerae]
MIEAGSRRRNQPAPPHVVCEALVHPDRDPARPWLDLRPDEVRPEVVDLDAPHLVVWSSLWPVRPDARLRFDLPWDAGHQGTDLRWTLFVAGELPGPSLLGHLRRRVQQLINADLRYSFGQ